MPVRAARPADTSPPPSAPAVVASPPSVAAPAATPDRPAGADTPPAPVNDKVAIKNRQILTAAHNLLLVQQADERAFDVVKTPESVRATIRSINEDYGKKTRDGLSIDPDQISIDRQIGLGIANNDEAERARRAAIGAVLGAEAANDFAAAEYAEARRLRMQYRKQWAEELDAKAPRPPGMPQSPH